MSFECPHCGYANNEIQSAGRIQDMGCNIKLLVSSSKVICQVNPLTPMSDQDIISPYNINSISTR